MGWRIVFNLTVTITLLLVWLLDDLLFHRRNAGRRSVKKQKSPGQPGRSPFRAFQPPGDLLFILCYSVSMRSNRPVAPSTASLLP